ncbi:MAG TPA: hypothetical protein VEQ63_00310 [Bryobacteraceae bacterium]|nr:hypothetical protein [Bryobacteraceae bacterium]
MSALALTDTPRVVIDRTQALNQRRYTLVLVYLLFAVLAVAMQWIRASYDGEFNGYPDEPAHYVTGLMVRDYVAQGFPRPPMAFARDYYLHYPKVAMGQWPPFFYVVEAAWMLVFPVTQPSMLVFMACLAASLATLVYSVSRSAGAGFWVSIGMGVTLLTSSAVADSYSMVMADVLGTVLSFGAAVSFAAYLASGRLRDAILFGVWSVLAIHTRSNSLALMLLPPLAIAMNRSWHLLRRPATWIPAIMVAVICGPWQALMAKGAASTFARSFELDFVRHAAIRYAWLIGSSVGPILLVFALIGLYTRVITPLRTGRPVQPIWAVLGALAASVWVFHLIIPAGIEFRYVLTAVPALLIFTAGGLITADAWARARIGARSRHIATAAVILLAFSYIVFARKAPPSYSPGLGRVAEELVGNKEFAEDRILISSDGFGEGIFIASAAMRDNRPGHYVLRATKILAEVDWNARSYRRLAQTPEEAMRLLRSFGVRMVVLYKGASTRWGHHAMLKRAIQERSSEWQPLESPALKQQRLCKGCEILVFRAVEAPRDLRPLELHLNRMLRRPAITGATP